VLIWAWIEPFRQAFGGGPDFSFTYFANWQYYLVIAGVIVLGWMMVMLVRSNRSAEDLFSKAARLREIRTSVILCVIGGLFVIAGYLPIVTLYSPNLNERFSRVNLFALPGASIFLVSLLYLIVVSISRYSKEIQALLMVSIIPLLVIGGITQIWLQYDTHMAWREQEQIWQELFELVPDLVDDTSVILVLPGHYECRGFTWKRTPFTYQNVGISMLYGNDTLSIGVVFPDLDSVIEFRQEGIINLDSGKIIPYSESIILIRNDEQGLQLVTDLQMELDLTWHIIEYQPHQRILNGVVPAIEWRKLVGVSSP
jgi:hypothetical protein